MGLFKIIGLFSGLPIRPTTGRERSRMYQRQANDLLEEQLYAIQNLSQQQVTPFPNDTRPRGTCPACHELMIVGASMCPHCQTEGIFWPETKVAAEQSLRPLAEQSLRPLSELQKDYKRNRQLNTNAKPKRGKLFRRVQIIEPERRNAVESESERLNRTNQEKEARRPANVKNYADKVREAQSKKLGG